MLSMINIMQRDEVMGVCYVVGLGSSYSVRLSVCACFFGMVSFSLPSTYAFSGKAI